jgi:hypothetical protein
MFFHRFLIRHCLFAAPSSSFIMNACFSHTIPISFVANNLVIGLAICSITPCKRFASQIVLIDIYAKVLRPHKFAVCHPLNPFSER